jgi:hypothetical protein
MKRGVAALLFVTTFSAVVMADEPGDEGTVNDRELGRVFMSAAERRQLDLLRTSLPATERSGATNDASQVEAVPQKRKPLAVGYIVSPNGRPYQWIDGDFRHVNDARIDATDSSRSIEITRHEPDSARQEQLPSEVEPESSETGSGLEVEAGNADRAQQ